MPCQTRGFRRQTRRNQSAGWFVLWSNGRIREIHLAGYEDKGDYLIDAHNNRVADSVWALSAAFPACHRILGETCFNGLAHRFIEHTPSELADLNHYGEPFSDFLDDWTATHAALANYRYLGDLTRLEWYCHTAYYAADDPPFDFKALARASRDAADTLRLRLSPSLHLLQSPYPVMEIRDANLYHEDAAQVCVDEMPESLVVSRPGMQVLVERVDTICFELLLACQAGSTLAEIANNGRQPSNSLLQTLEFMPVNTS